MCEVIHHAVDRLRLLLLAVALLSCCNRWGHVLDGYSYTHDPLGLRTNITRNLGLTTNSFGVNLRAKAAADVAKPVARFAKQKLGQQIEEYNRFLQTYIEHLAKYGQQPGETFGEVNRIERQIQEYRRILESRGVTFDNAGRAIHP